MPFVDGAEPVGLSPQLAEPPQVVPPVPPFGKLFEAAMGRDNPYVSAAEAFLQPTPAPYDPDFDPFRNIQGYEDYASAFIAANNEDDVYSVKTRIDAERKRASLLDAGGWRGTVANIGAGLADPVMLIPVGGELVAVSRAGRVLQGALHTGLAAGLSTAAQEAALQATQLTRPISESLETVAAATLLGGVLGAGAGAISRETAASAAKAGEVYERELSSNLSPSTESTAGAAAVRGTTLDQETIANTLGVDRALAFSSPTLRLAGSDSVEVRRIAQELADQPLVTRGNIEGIPSPISVERGITLAQGPLAEALTGLDDAFVRYRLGRAQQFGDITRIALRDTAEALRTRAAMTYQEFAEAVGKAMRRGDISDVPEVAEAAKGLRAKVFEPLKDKAIEARLLPADVPVETAVSYLSRVYNTNLIAAQRPEFERIIANWLPTTKAKELEGLSDLDLRDIARQITDQLLHSAPGRTNYSPIPLARGPLRERTLSIPDELIEKYLESDVRHIARSYTRTMASDTELTRAFGRADMEPAFDRVRENYAQLREGVTDEGRLRRMDTAMQRDLRDLGAVRDRIRGTFGLPSNPNGLWNRTYHVVRDLNYLRLLGGMTISAFPDLGRTVMVHGLMRVIGDGIVPLVAGFRQFRLAANEVKLAGNALDMVLDTRAMAMADMLDDYGRWSRYERGLKAMTDQFGVVTLMAPWNAALKQFVGVVSQTRALRAIESLAGGGRLAVAERTRLAHLGIGPDEADRIWEQFAQHGTKPSRAGETWWANTAAWTDQRAADVFRAAMSKEVDIAIVTPGQEKPLWMSAGIGKVIGQFRSFAFASTQRVLMTGLQQRDMAALNGVLLMTALGMGANWVRHQLDQANPAAERRELPDSVAQWLKEGVDRSGLIGWLFDAHNIVEKLTRGTVGVSQLTGGPPLSRYAARGVLESVLGPTVGLGEAAVQAVGAASSGEWTDADRKAVRRMVPYQNAQGFRHLFDMAEAGLKH
jgi:hypothetical protein